MITASIVTYKTSSEELSKIVNCVAVSSIEKVYIIDNSPTAELSVFEQSSPKVEYYHGHGNIGYGTAHNIAIKKSLDANARYHVILNPDIEFDPNSINEIKSFMDNDSSIGMIMPRVVYPDGQIQYLCKLLPHPIDWIGRRFIPFKKYVENRNSRFELRESGYDKIMNIPYLSGCFMFLRNDAIKRVGMFDEKIFMYAEDTDLTRRIHSKFKTLYYPNITIVHNHNKESYRSSKLLIIHIKSAIYYFNKWGWFFDKERKAINKQILESIKLK